MFYDFVFSPITQRCESRDYMQLAGETIRNIIMVV